VKAEVQVPKTLFEESEVLSRSLGISRNELYSRALRRFVRLRARDDITARMDAALRQVGPPRDPGWEALGLEVLRRAGNPPPD
jgi:hypothetical protein